MHHAARMTPHHLARQAVMYLRPSTPHHVVSHQASRRWPDALGARAHQRGWPNEALDLLDDALGRTAATAHPRPGCKTLVAPGTLAQVGRIVSSDVPRRSRTCADGYPLLDLCGSKGGLMADGEGLDDPAPGNGRLLLGLQGTRSAGARHTRQARRTAGLIHKATRGALALTLPTGVVRTSQGTGHKSPHQEAHARLSLVCETFLPWRSARKVVAVCNTHALVLPRRHRCGALVWQAPRGAAVLAMLQQPASAGACTSGRRRTRRREATPARPASPRRPQAPWRLGLPDVSPLPSVGRRLSRCRPGAKSITPRMPGTQPAGSRALAQPSGSASSPAGHAATRGSCRRRGAPAPSVTPSAHRSGPLGVKIWRPIRSIRGAWRRCSRPARPWRAMARTKPWPSGSRPSASPPPTRRLARSYALRPPLVSANATTSIQRSGRWPPHWHPRGRWPCQPARRPPPPRPGPAPPGHSGPLPGCRWHSARPCGVVASTRWCSSGRGALRCTPAWCGAGARPRRVRCPWQAAHAPPCRARPRWRHRCGGCVPRAHATRRWPGCCPSPASARPVGPRSGPAPSRASASGRSAPSHPRRSAGSLTVPQLAKALGLPPPWGYHPSKRGTVVMQRKAPTRRSLFPDGPETLEAFAQ